MKITIEIIGDCVSATSALQGAYAITKHGSISTTGCIAHPCHHTSFAGSIGASCILARNKRDLRFVFSKEGGRK